LATGGRQLMADSLGYALSVFDITDRLGYTPFGPGFVHVSLAGAHMA
jgi:hypothetical protein